MAIDNNDKNKGRSKSLANLRPFVKGDPRINRLGAPKRGQSWQEAVKRITDMTREEAIAYLGASTKLGKQLRELPENVPIKDALIFASIIAYGREPNARMFQALTDREEGKPNQLITTGAASGSVPFSIPADMIAPSFLDAYRDIVNRRHTEYIFSGGRGSTKSSFVSLAIIYLLKNNPTMNALVMRQVADTLRGSVYAQLQWAISELGLSDEFKSTTSPMEIQYLPTGQTIYFRGADDPGKIKSIKTAFGYIGLLWFEEASEFSGNDAIRNVTQSAIRGGDAGFIFKSFNPPRTANNWINKYLLTPKETQYQHKSDYRNVPAEWLGKVFVEEAEFLYSINPDSYAHEYLGEVNGLGDQVFENLQIRAIADEEIGQFDNVLHGLDFGYYPHPAHYAKVHYDAARLTLYVFGELRKWKTSNRDMYDKLVEYGLTPNDYLICDTEEKSVEDYKKYGANAREASKGPGSVRYSMKWLQSLRAIVVDPVRAPYSTEELTAYAYERTKDGEILEAYPREKDDAIAAIRYATNLIWRRRGE